MTSEQLRDDAPAEEAPTTFEQFVEHFLGVLEIVTNLGWDDFEFHLDRMDAIAETVAASEKPLVNALRETVREFALGFRQFTTGKTPDDTEEAQAHLTRARNSLRKLRAEQRELTDNPGFVQFALGIETQLLIVQEQVARARGDGDEAARLTQQRGRLLDDIIETFDPDEPMRHYLEGFKRLQEALPKFVNGTQALLEMNLDLAQNYLEESSTSFSAMQDCFGKAKINTAIVKAGKSVAEGCGLIASGQDTYVRTLRAAIIGDVVTNDVKALENAERAFLDGAHLISEAAQAMPGAFRGINFEQLAKASQLTHNLRMLCERSLSPREIVRATAPKVVLFFLVTFLVLLFGLPFSGLVAELPAGGIALLLIVSLFVSVIGVFGLEATRLIPLLEVLTRLLPGAGRSEKKNGEPA